MLTAGGATRVINCEIGDGLCGQLHNRICERIRDDLEVNVLYLTGGAEPLLFVSLDLIAVETPAVRELGRAVEAATGLPARSVIVSCTHTHAGPYTIRLLHDVPLNDAYLAKLTAWTADAAREAVETARPARVGWGLGEAHAGYNRRLCWSDGSHSMYGDSTRPDFSGLEGPDDPSHAVLFAVDDAGTPVAVLHNNCCHSTCMEADVFATADFAGEARKRLREALAPGLPVLYLQGCSGDTSPWDMTAVPCRYEGDLRAEEIGMLLADETLRLIREAEPAADAPLGHAFEDIEMGVRLPSDERLAEARAIRDAGEEEAGSGDYVLAVAGALRLYDEFKGRPADTTPVHAVRVGDFALATNPCEMYCQFGIDIKRRSPAAVTAAAQLTDGFCGYCPTIYGLMGGGYSGDPIHWCRLEPYAGYKMVDEAARLIRTLWT